MCEQFYKLPGTDRYSEKSFPFSTTPTPPSPPKFPPNVLCPDSENKLISHLIIFSSFLYAIKQNKPTQCQELAWAQET
jgi:hypothetical protein